jgi:hypothetical protein
MKLGDPIPIPKLPDELVNEVREHIRTFSVSIIIGPESERPVPCAGILCTTEHSKGVLTARHVWEQWKERPAVLLAGSRAIRIDETAVHAVAPAATSSELKGINTDVPDIAFVTLSAATCSTVEALGKAFYNLDRHAGNEAAQIGSAGFYITHGTPDVLTDAGTKKAANFTYVTRATNAFEKGDWDYIEVGLDLSGNPDIPEKLGGVSGGGVWRGLMYQEEGSSVLTIPDIYEDIALVGVNFYQTAGVESSVLIGHGPRSIYETLRAQIQRKHA